MLHLLAKKVGDTFLHRTHIPHTEYLELVKGLNPSWPISMQNIIGLSPILTFLIHNVICKLLVHILCPTPTTALVISHEQKILVASSLN